MTNDVVDTVIKPIKSKPNRGGGGAANVSELNGPEIKRWLHHASFLRLALLTEDEAVIEMLHLFHKWSTVISKYSNKIHTWSKNDFTEFNTMYDDMKANWERVAGCRSTPRMHILGHYDPFAKLYGSVGYYSESPMESIHNVFNDWMKNHHFNLSDDIESARRTLANMIVDLIAPFYETSKNTKPKNSKRGKTKD